MCVAKLHTDGTEQIGNSVCILVLLLHPHHRLSGFPCGWLLRQLLWGGHKFQVGKSTENPKALMCEMPLSCWYMWRTVPLNQDPQV
jgi:hypothetical protein